MERSSDIYSNLKMAIKVLVTQIGQQLLAEVKQVENKETKEIVGYWLTNPRTVNYDTTEDGQVSVNFGTYCLVSNESEFSVRAEHIVAILEPREEVLERYNSIVEPEEVTDESAVGDVEDGTDTGESE